MIDLLPADLATALKECVTAKAFDSRRFDELLAARPGLEKFRRELIADVYVAMVDRIENERMMA